MSRENLRIEFAPDDELDSFAYIMVSRLFDLDPEDFIITNESTLFDFLPDEDRQKEKEDLGHTLLFLRDMSLDDQDLYKDIPASEETKRSLMVWYPPLSGEEEENFHEMNQLTLVSKIESTFGTAMTDFEGEMTVYQVANFLTMKKLEEIKSLPVNNPTKLLALSS